MKFKNIIGNRRINASLIVFITTLSILILFIFNPSDYYYFHLCLFRTITGYDCPGCGGLRGIHQLLNGNIRDALNFNLMLILAVPAGGYLFLSNVWIVISGKSLPEIPYNRILILVLILIIIAYWILRNIVVIRF